MPKHRETENDALWMTVTVNAEGNVTVHDEANGADPTTFGTVMEPAGAELANLLLAMAKVSGSTSGTDPGELVENAVGWLRRNGFVS